MHRVLASPYEITNCLVLRLRNDDGRELGGPQQARQQQSVTAISFDPVSWLTRDSRRRNHIGRVSLLPQGPHEAVTTWPSFMTNTQLLWLTNLRKSLGQRDHAVAGCSQKPRRFAKIGVRVRNGDRVFMHIQSNKGLDICSHDQSSSDNLFKISRKTILS